MNTHKFLDKNVLFQPFPDPLKSLLIPGIIWVGDERRGAGHVIQYGTPREYKQLKHGGSPDIIGEVEFIVGAIHKLCIFEGVTSLSVSLLYGNRKAKRIGFLPLAFDFGGVKHCPIECFNVLLTEFSNKRAKPLQQSGHFGLSFFVFKDKVAKATSHGEVRTLCEKLCPLLVQKQQVSDDITLTQDSFMRRCGRISPEDSGAIVQILKEHGGCEGDDDELIVDYEAISTVGKRKLDQMLPPDDVDGPNPSFGITFDNQDDIFGPAEDKRIKTGSETPEYVVSLDDLDLSSIPIPMDIDEDEDSSYSTIFAPLRFNIISESEFVNQDFDAFPVHLRLHAIAMRNMYSPLSLEALNYIEMSSADPNLVWRIQLNALQTIKTRGVCF